MAPEPAGPAAPLKPRFSRRQRVLASLATLTLLAATAYPVWRYVLEPYVFPVEREPELALPLTPAPPAPPAPPVPPPPPWLPGTVELPLTASGCAWLAGTEFEDRARPRPATPEMSCFCQVE